MIKNIVFDLGGVIADIDQDAALASFRRLGVPNIESYLDPYEQKGIFKMVETGELGVDDFINAINTIVGHKIEPIEIYCAWQSFIKGVKVEKLQFINKLNKHYMVYLLSNTNPFVMQWAESIDFSEDNIPMQFYFDRMFLSYEMGLTKPDKRIFEKMIEQTEMRPEETLFIDDSQANIETARKLGFQTYCPTEGEDWHPAINLIINNSKI